MFKIKRVLQTQTLFLVNNGYEYDTYLLSSYFYYKIAKIGEDEYDPVIYLQIASIKRIMNTSIPSLNMMNLILIADFTIAAIISKTQILLF